MEKTNKINIRVRYSETDKMGVVYHGNYAQYLEMARVEWLRELGVSYRWMEENGVMLPVVSLQLNYRKSARYDDVLTVEARLKNTPSVKIEFDYTIFDESNKIIAEGNTVLAFINAKTFRPMRCPDYILNKL
ncbi:acyl-CoA thioesterase [Galbibacter pacificus]|uniref:Thioesterase family protein n=1 Tax=Galbibacter pacificus TaxID=2996052 RepID=A0ABT6FPG2_9FLAO|nr:thioesterase family protein [Galbibacter pacificus]MDG3582369.1 thioesterase family protein [Galbibacter pacificus]MDG3585155.1 thioesterase family protein [Galbibacter pacificus]